MTSSRRVEPPHYDVGRLEPALRRYFRRRAAPHEVEDLVQDVFMRLQGRQDPTAIEDIDRYVFVVAANVLARRYRAESRRSQVQEADAEDYEEQISPERVLLGREQLNAALAVLQKLPPRTRQIFILHRFEDMTYPRIALSLGISKSAVEKHMIRALKALHGRGDS
jgi:RNA polymerase sigma-70 factor (ECF subfamily)